MDLVTIWAGIIAFAVFAYVVLDGFDLGIGIIFHRFQKGSHRDQAMNAIAPFWDGNQTWLVMGGGGLLAAFPIAYAILLPATYPLIIAMLLGLVLRGVSFEFRWRDPAHEKIWDLAFASGSFIAAFSQGVILGAILQGVKVENNAYAGGLIDWLSPFSLLTGLCVVLGYALLGATWLIWRTKGEIQSRARTLAFGLTFWVIGGIALVSLATLFLQEAYWRHWFSFPRILIAAPVPILTALAALRLITGIDRAKDHIPFFMAMALFVLGYCGLAISLYPYLIPPSVTLHDAAAPHESLSFLLYGAVFIIPMILTYTGWAYWVFRGKVKSEGGYH